MVARVALTVGRRCVELWRTSCCVTSPPGAAGQTHDVLINSANQQLVGTKLPYFPRGGPVPDTSVAAGSPEAVQRDWVPPGFVSRWGGMEIGAKMLYPVQVVDGMVGILGGAELRRACSRLPTVSADGARCAIGEAVSTPAFGKLRQYYARIVHTVAPFHTRADKTPTPDWALLLERCWHSSLAQASDAQTIVAPLLGAGARGAPLRDAATVAARATVGWLTEEAAAPGAPSAQLLRIVVQRETALEEMAAALRAEASSVSSAGDLGVSLKVMDAAEAGPATGVDSTFPGWPRFERVKQ